LTAAARTVPDCVQRDFGRERMSGYQVRTGATYSRIRANSNNSVVEAYVVTGHDPLAKKYKDRCFAFGVATISIARVVPVDSFLDQGLVNVFGQETDGKMRSGVVGTFWFGHGEGLIKDVDYDYQAVVGSQIAGLLVPRMVEIANHHRLKACTFVASEESGEPDISSPMREHMTKVATGKWIEPVDNLAVEYDLLVA